MCEWILACHYTPAVRCAAVISHLRRTLRISDHSRLTFLLEDGLGDAHDSRQMIASSSRLMEGGHRILFAIIGQPKSRN